MLPRVLSHPPLPICTSLRVLCSKVGLCLAWVQSWFLLLSLEGGHEREHRLTAPLAGSWLCEKAYSPNCNQESGSWGRLP